MGRENESSGFSDSIRKMFLAGVGAAAITVEKSGEIINSLVEKGEVIVDQSRESSEEAKRKRRSEKVQNRIDGLVNSLSSEDLDKLKEAIRVREEEAETEEEEEEDLFDESDSSDVMP